MRKLIIFAIWLVPQLLTATPAHGELISGLVAGLGLVATDLLATSSAYWLGATIGAAIYAALPSLLLSTALNVGVALIANALRPQTPVPTPSQRLVNLRQTAQSRTRAYGRVRTGGPVLFWQAAGGKRYVVVAINTGEIDAIEEHWLGERTATLSSGSATDAYFQSGGSSCIQIEPFVGTDTQSTPALIAGAFAGSRPYKGIAGAALAFRNPKADDFAGVYPDGREPVYAPVYRAVLCYDPRKDSTRAGGSGSHREDDSTTWEWTLNAALIMADWLVHEDGLGAAVDWDLVMAEADVCDTTLLDRDGNTVKKWELSGAYSFDQRRADVWSQMAVACDAMRYETDEGKQAFFVGRYIEPAYTITDTHIISGELSEGQEGTARPNAVVAQFTDPAAGYRENDAASFYEADGEAYQEEHLSVLWANKHNQAVRVAKRFLRIERAQYEVSLKLNLYGLVLRDQRFFTLDWDELGISSIFEISSWAFTDDGMGIAVAGRSVVQGDFDFNSATEEPAPSTITGGSGSVVIEDAANVTLDSPTAGTIRVDWDPPSRSGIYARMHYRVVGDPDWIEVAPGIGVYFVEISGLAADDYEAEVQWRTAAVQGDWITSTPSSVTVS